VLARPARAQIPKVLQLTTPPTVSVSSANPLQQWAENIQHLPSLIPLELIVLFAFVIFFIIWIGKMIYRHYTQTRARTVLTLEIGNYNDTTCNEPTLLSK